MQVGIIGLGSMGMNHVRVLRDYLQVNPIFAFDNSSKYANFSISGVNIVTNFDEFLKLNKSSLYVVIATPTPTHEQYSLELLSNNINFIIEKPLAENFESAVNIFKKSKLSSSSVCVGMVERFNSAIILAKKKLEDGIVGKIFQITTSRQGPYPIRIKDTGVLNDLACHDIDLVHFLADDKYLRIFADIIFKNNEHVEDGVLVIARTVSGISVLHNINWYNPFKERKIKIIGELGVLEIDCLLSKLTYFESASVEIENPRLANISGVSEGTSLQFAFPKKESLLLEHESFMSYLFGNKSNLTCPSLIEAIETTKVIEALKRSYNSQKVINL